MANKWAPWKMLSLTNVTQSVRHNPAAAALRRQSSLYSHVIHKFSFSFLVKRMSLGFVFMSLDQHPNRACHFVSFGRRLLCTCRRFVFLRTQQELYLPEFLSSFMPDSPHKKWVWARYLNSSRDKDDSGGQTGHQDMRMASNDFNLFIFFQIDSFDFFFFFF